MTAPHDPDDLASALLDGLLPDDEAAAARRDSAVAARLAELEAVRDAVRRAPPPADPVARERRLAAALAAFDAVREETSEPGRHGGPDEPGTAAVTPMVRSRTAAHVGAGRRGWLTAAAVVLAVVGLGFLARDWGSGGDREDTAATSAEESSGEGGEGAASSAESGNADRGNAGADETEAAPAAPDGAVVDLGDVGSPDALADAARVAVAERPEAELERSAGDESAGGGGSDAQGGALQPACADDGLPPAVSSGSTVLLRARANLEGQPVDVWVLDTEGRSRLVAVDAGCAVVVDEALDG